MRKGIRYFLTCCWQAAVLRVLDWYQCWWGYCVSLVSSGTHHQHSALHHCITVRSFVSRGRRFCVTAALTVQTPPCTAEQMGERDATDRPPMMMLIEEGAPTTLRSTAMFLAAPASLPKKRNCSQRNVHSILSILKHFSKQQK